MRIWEDANQCGDEQWLQNIGTVPTELDRGAPLMWLWRVYMEDENKLICVLNDVIATAKKVQWAAQKIN